MTLFPVAIVPILFHLPPFPLSIVSIVPRVLSLLLLFRGLLMPTSPLFANSSAFPQSHLAILALFALLLPILRLKRCATVHNVPILLSIGLPNLALYPAALAIFDFLVLS